MRRIGLLGGTFDPIHFGHLLIGEVLGEELSLDTVLLVPAESPPHKPTQPVTPAHHRKRMCELAASDNPRFSVSDLDLNGSRQSYTVDLLDRAAATYPNAALYFLMGTDSLRDLPTWYHTERIAQLARIGAANRPGFKFDLATLVEKLPHFRDRVELVHAPGLQVSATELRERIRTGRSIRYLTPDSVRCYIVERGLYLTESSASPRSR